MSALVTVLQRETVRAHGGPSAPAATSIDARPVSAARATAIASIIRPRHRCCICRNQCDRPYRCFNRCCKFSD
eukprot:213650-Pleurochrysis_carterae.AAC.1